jgi:hypothetical protein
MFEVLKDALLSKANSLSKLGGASLITINLWGSSHEMLGITPAPGSMFSTISQQGMLRKMDGAAPPHGNFNLNLTPLFDAMKCSTINL